MPNYFSAFCGSVKLAFGPAEADRVLSIVKSKQINPKAVQAYTRAKLPSLFAFSGARRTQQAHALEKELARHKPEEARQFLQKQHAAYTEMIKKIAPQGAVVQRAPVTMGFEQSLRGAGAPARPPSDQRKMLEAIAKGHELDELQVRPRTSFKRRFGHNSPDVILREHNRLTTLPTENAPVKAYLQQIRKTEATPVLAQYGIDFGKSERLSRHARKRLSEMMERDALPSGAR